MKIVPYNFRKARFQYGEGIGYWVRLYLFFDGESTHTFFHESEMIENSCLARELGYNCTTFTEWILVTPKVHPHIFKEIDDYVQDSHYD